jgi:hypothetical protein
LDPLGRLTKCRVVRLGQPHRLDEEDEEEEEEVVEVVVEEVASSP